MATATTTRGVFSPYAIADVDAAYVAYLNAPFAKSPTFNKPTKAQFKKMHAARHAEAKAREDAKIAKRHAPATSTPDVDLDKFEPDQARIIAKALGIEYTEPEPEPETGVDLSTLVTSLVQSGADADTIAAAVLAFTGANGSANTVDTSGQNYRQRVAPEDRDPLWARNAVLWALNTEGFLQIVPEGGCEPITQEDGQALMTEEFGPLVPRTA